jgi:two-component system chemotaxis response regulator CheB
MNESKHGTFTRDILVIGASAGGVEALLRLVEQFPPDLPAAVFVVLHIPAEYPSKLPEILSYKSHMPVIHPENAAEIKRGTIYVAPTDRHLVLRGNQIFVTRGPTENNFRPAIDVLFRSAAASFGQRVIGVILTGVLDDGAAGLFAVKTLGGKAVVQDPNDALYGDMPKNAMKVVKVDHCVPLSEMGGLLSSMVNESVETGDSGAPVAMELEVDIALEDNAFEKGVLELGELTSYTCPECHGALAQITEGKLVRFRCHTGHAFSLNTLLVDVTKSIDRSLWATLKTIEESQLLMEHLAKHLQEGNQTDSAKPVLKKAEEAKKRAKAIRELVLNHEILSQENIGVNENA